MENYRKVHLRGVLINNTSRLRYLAQPEERGLSHSCQTQWVVGASESSWEVAATATKTILHFRCSQTSRSGLRLKISDKARGERKSI